MKNHTICLIGGSGFVGRHLICELLGRGHGVRVLTRRRERHRELLVHPTLEVRGLNVHDQESLTAALEGCSVAVNLVGILNQTRNRGRSFEDVHMMLVDKLVGACEAGGVSRLLHVSALGASAQAPSDYLKTKAAGEDRAHQARAPVAVTSFRPSVIFGHDDSFFNRFAGLLAMTPLVLPLASPDAVFSPVFVNDVVSAISNAMDDPATAGKRLDLVGPDTYTLRELVAYTARIRGLRRYVWGLGNGLSNLQAAILGRLPGAPLSADNLRSMRVPSTSENNALPSLGVTPTSIEAVVPSYLGEREVNTRYQTLRESAGRN